MPKRASARLPITNLHHISPIDAISKCPNEILGEIFSMACVDGGATGCSLSLVSKHISDVSKRFKYQTLLLKQKHLRTMALILQNLSLNDRRVVHLFIQSSVWGDGTCSCSFEDRFFQTDKNRLLVLVAHSLRTLEVGSNRAQLLLPITFPALQDLTLHGDLEVEKHSKRTTGCYPALKRLHISNCEDGIESTLDGSIFFPLIPRAAPALEVFKISRCEILYSTRIAIEGLLQNPTSLKIVVCHDPRGCAWNRPCVEELKYLAQSHKQIAVEERLGSQGQLLDIKGNINVERETFMWWLNICGEHDPWSTQSTLDVFREFTLDVMFGVDVDGVDEARDALLGAVEG